MEQDNRYASPKIRGEHVVNSQTVDISTHLQNLPVVIDADNPMLFEDIASAKRWLLRKTGLNSFTLHEIDANGYNMGSTNLLDASEPVLVDPDTGEVKFKTTSVLSPNGLKVGYTQDLSSGPTNAGRVTIRLVSEMIHAVPHKLRAQYVFDSGFAAQKSFGVNIEESLIAACTSEIKQERDTAIIDLLNKQAGSRSQWSSKITNYISKREHDESFIAELFQCTTQIFQKTLRVHGNWVVVGKRGLDILNSVGAPRFMPVTDNVTPNGPYHCGILDGRLNVFCTPYLKPDEYIVGYKGADIYDAGFVVGDYLPIASTDFIMLDDFVGRKGFVSYYGTKMLNPNMYVSGKITQD